MKKKKENNTICHRNTWWWGETFRVVVNGGIGLVEIQFETAMPSVAYITGLSVVDGYQQQGIATAMMKSCEELAIKSGKAFLQLTVEKDNEWLREWYERLGFVVFNEEEHVFVMVKALAVRETANTDNGYYKVFNTTHDKGGGS